MKAAVLAFGFALAPAASAAPPSLFFDDFSYSDLAALTAAGWRVRDGEGHPGLPGGRFAASQVSLVDDPARPGNRLLRLSATSDGTGPGTVQAQACHQRKFLHGTYAARVRFSDLPRGGAAGDYIVESFYAVSALAHPFDPDEQPLMPHSYTVTLVK